MVKKATRAEMNRKRLDVLEFAKKFDLVINPAKGMELQVEYFFKFGYCPCDVTRQRTKCPCDEALEDIRKTGHCLCRLFWRDLDTFMKIYKESDEKTIDEKNGTGPDGRGSP